MDFTPHIHDDVPIFGGYEALFMNHISRKIFYKAL